MLNGMQQLYNQNTMPKLDDGIQSYKYNENKMNDMVNMKVSSRDQIQSDKKNLEDNIQSNWRNQSSYNKINEDDSLRLKSDIVSYKAKRNGSEIIKYDKNIDK